MCLCLLHFYVQFRLQLLPLLIHLCPKLGKQLTLELLSRHVQLSLDLSHLAL